MREQGKDRNKTTPAVMCIKILLQIFNFFYLLIGIAILGTGIFVKVKLSEIISLTGLYYDNSAYVMIGVGVLILLVAVGGFYCTAKHRIALLYLYAIFIAFVAILQLVAGILGGVYHDTIATAINDGLEKNIGNKKLNRTWEIVQSTFHCCGITGYKDWLKLDQGAIPNSCFKKPPVEEVTRGKRQAGTSNSTIGSEKTTPETVPTTPTTVTTTPTTVTTTPTAVTTTPTPVTTTPTAVQTTPTTVTTTPVTTIAVESPPSPTTTQGVEPSTTNDSPTSGPSPYYPGCSSKLTKMAREYMVAIIGVCVGFIVFQIMGTVLACCLAKKVGRNNYEQIY